MRDLVDVTIVFDNVLGHEAVHVLNTALSIACCHTEILAARTTRQAGRVVTRFAHNCYDEVTTAQGAHIVADVDNFSERFVSQYEVIAARRGRAETKGADVAVGPTDADVEDVQFEFARRGDRRLGVIDDAHLAGAGEDANSSHTESISPQFTERRRNLGCKYLFASSLFVKRIICASQINLPSTRMATTPNGVHCANGPERQNAKGLGPEDRRPVGHLEGHAETVSGVAVMPDGKRAVSASWDKMLKVWLWKPVCRRLLFTSMRPRGLVLWPAGKRSSPAMRVAGCALSCSRIAPGFTRALPGEAKAGELCATQPGGRSLCLLPKYRYRRPLTPVTKAIEVEDIEARVTELERSGESSRSSGR